MPREPETPATPAQAGKDDPLSSTSDHPGFPVRQGVLVRARNGDLIRYDATGVTLRLSDRVIEDIRQRLGAAPVAAGAAAAPASAGDLAAAEAALEAVDAWDIRIEGEWLRFSARLPGRQGARGFRKRLPRAEGGSTGGIIADAPGPLMGILGLGGARAALASAERPGFPFHVLGADDDIGAVGQSGVDAAAETDGLDQLREVTHEALVADACLGWQIETHGPLPLFVARAETDRAASAAELAQGPAFDNLMIAAANLRRAATALGKEPRIFCVALDFALEELSGSATAYRDAMIALMARIEAGLAAQGYDRPLFVTRLDAGAPGRATEAQVAGQWELAWNHGDHRLITSAPGYMFETDAYDRPTPAARRRMAEMTAAAVTAATPRPREPDPLTDGWRCPIFHLAEIEADAEGGDGGPVIRMIAQALAPLVLDAAEAPGGGHPVGFTLRGATNGARITGVSIDPADPQTVRLHLDRAPEGEAVSVAYGWGAPDADAGQAVRDGWELAAADGGTLHRWALPCVLPVHPGRGARHD